MYDINSIMKTLEVGCGPNKQRADSVGIDITPNSAADIIWDLNISPWPLDSDSFDEVICTHVFEHLENRLGVIEEMHRVLRKGGAARISGPHFSCCSFYSDITHKFPFSWRMFDFLEEGSKIDTHYTHAKFKIVSRRIVFYKEQQVFLLPFFFVRFPKLWEKYFAFIFPARQIEFVLQPIK